MAVVAVAVVVVVAAMAAATAVATSTTSKPHLKPKKRRKMGGKMADDGRIKQAALDENRNVVFVKWCWWRVLIGSLQISHFCDAGLLSELGLKEEKGVRDVCESSFWICVSGNERKKLGDKFSVDNEKTTFVCVAPLYRLHPLLTRLTYILWKTRKRERRERVTDEDNKAARKQKERRVK
jgi:hypothetical protein